MNKNIIMKYTALLLTILLITPLLTGSESNQSVKEDLAREVVALSVVESDLEIAFREGMRIQSGGLIPDAEVNEMSGKIWTYLVNNGFVDVANEVNVAVLVEDFSSEELRQLAEFYSTPLGRKVVELQVRSTIRQMEETAAWMAQHEDAIMDILFADAD